MSEGKLSSRVSNLASIEEFSESLDEPSAYESRFEWQSAAHAYRRQLSGLTKNNPSRSKLFEKLGHAYFRAAMQSETIREFRSRIKSSSNAYKEALSSNRGRVRDSGLSLACQAWQVYLRYWLSRNPMAKARLLDRTWSMTKKALTQLANSGDYLNQARTYDQLSGSAAVGFDFHWDSQARRHVLREGIEYGRQAAKVLSETESPHGELLSRICAQIALLIDALEEDGIDPQEETALEKEGLECWNRALHLSRDSAILQTAFSPYGFTRVLGDAESDKAAQEALLLAEKRKDNLAIGFVLDQLSGKAFFKAFPPTDRSENIRLAVESLNIAERAERRHRLTNSTPSYNGVIWPGSPYAEHFIQVSWFQTDPEKKRLYVEKSRSETASLLRRAKLSAQPRIIAYSHHVMGGTLIELADTERNIDRKTRLLRRALRHERMCSRITERVQPKAIQYVGAYIGELGAVKAKLAGIAKNRQSKIRLLKATIREQEKGLRLLNEYTDKASKGQSHPLRRNLAAYYLAHGNHLVHLYKVTGDERVLRKAAKAYEELISNLKGTPVHRTIAEGRWKAAQVYDALGAHVAASSYFSEASEAYGALAEKTPQLSSLYQDCARYLEAWKHVEDARAAHARLQFDLAEKDYRSASSLHKSAGRWSFLSSYYTGLAELESGENLSRLGRSSESILAFQDAMKVFSESRLHFQSQLGFLDQPEERAMVENLIGDSRVPYCEARIAIEEARIAEAQGDYLSSSEKFGIAAAQLRKVWRSSKSAKERAEIRYISLLSDAWQQAARGMSGDSRGFTSAVERFEDAVKHAYDEDSRTLAIAHSHFCRAIRSNARFNESLEPADYEAAERYFADAVTHFAKAGFEKASAHAQASRLLLNAHYEIVDATKPDNQAMNAHYLNAETLLRDAAISFEKAGQPAKKERVQRLIESIDRQLKQPSEPGIWDIASDVSISVAFSPPIQRGTSPIGNSRFAGPDIEARYLEPTPKQPQSTDYQLVIQIGNTGPRPIRLLKLDGAVPHGAQLLNGPEGSKLAEGSLFLDEKRIDPLGTETIRILLRSNGKDLVIANPRIVFADEKGHQLQRALPPLIVDVPPILKFLVDEFLVDYNLRRLTLNAAGWRTLVNVTEHLGIPRSHLYGEPRYGRRYGAQLRALVESGLVESRIFPRERGRGGQVTKVRAIFESPIVKRLAESVTGLERPVIVQNLISQPIERRTTGLGTTFAAAP